MKRAPLATFILNRLAERDETVEHFSNRVGINASGFGRFLRGATQSLHYTRTLDKVAFGLGMSRSELISLAEGQTALDEGSSKAEVMARLPELEEVIRGLPRPLWGTVLRFTIDAAQQFAQGLALAPRTEVSTRRTSTTNNKRVAAITAPARPKRRLTTLYPAFA